MQNYFLQILQTNKNLIGLRFKKKRQVKQKAIYMNSKLARKVIETCTTTTTKKNYFITFNRMESSIKMNLFYVWLCNAGL